MKRTEIICDRTRWFDEWIIYDLARSKVDDGKSSQRLAVLGEALIFVFDNRVRNLGHPPSRNQPRRQIELQASHLHPDRPQALPSIHPAFQTRPRDTKERGSRSRSSSLLRVDTMSSFAERSAVHFSGRCQLE